MRFLSEFCYSFIAQCHVDAVLPLRWRSKRSATQRCPDKWQHTHNRSM